ncbi:MAG: hypothetical protein M0T85_09340 [Dehalococcoidales bacterium]|nr:hypothetical protein [Dehalococcoidales bacterium]
MTLDYDKTYERKEGAMTPDRIIVTLAGLAAIAFVAWFFWFPKSQGHQGRCCI